jgi:N-acetylmuramoyl-L-alanine amidase
MPTSYTVKQGDCLTKIAHKFGFHKFETIYADASNDGLRELRPNPHLLHPGDVVNIPDKAAKIEARSTGRRHTFKVPVQRRYLQIAVEDDDGTPLANTDYELDVRGEIHKGQTDANGELKHDIPLDAETSTLMVQGYVWNLYIAYLNPAKDAPDKGVSGIQARLSNLGYEPGPIDGILGPRTDNAIRAFQADNSPLKVDGICGPKTLAELINHYGC